MDVTIIKGTSNDRISIIRSDGSHADTSFAKKGPFPHDVVHYAVEKHLGLASGFWGMVAAGHHPEELVEIAKMAGHASAKRAEVPQPHIVELLQAERIVECFEADMWGGGAEETMLLETIELACGYSHVPVPPMDGTSIAAIRDELAQLGNQWANGRIEFQWAA
jgi:hypothetical protein